MKKRLLYLLFLLGLYTPSVWGQTAAPGDGNPIKELRTSLAGLDPSRISTGVLLDRMMWITNPHRFAGAGDTTTEYNGFTQQYWEFYHAALDSSQLLTLDMLRTRIDQKVRAGTVPLLMLRYNYNEIARDAAAQGAATIDSVNALVTDGPNRSAKLYDTGQFFSVAIPPTSSNGTFTLYVGPEFWLGTIAPPSTVQIDLGDGQGIRQVPMGSTVQVTQASTQPIKLVYNGLIAAARIPLTANPLARGTNTTNRVTTLSATIPPDLALGLVASRKWPGFTPTKGIHGPNGEATAIAWIKYADSNTGTNRKLRRPLVFVEGIDFSLYRGGKPFFPSSASVNHPITQTGPLPLSDFNTGLSQIGGYRNGSAGWEEMVNYNNDYKSLEKLPALREQLVAPTTTTFPNGGKGGDYDVIYLDFTDGASLIQDNAMVLAELLNWINQPANRTTDAEETMVIGTSMGGQVSRFALAWMEQQGLCHNSKLYVSFDSPNRGANVSLGIQDMFDRLQKIWIGSGSAEDVVNNQLMREASMQMIVFHFNEGAKSYRQQWQGWQLGANSYPSLLRKVAVANGSGDAVAQAGMVPGMQLLHSDNGLFSGYFTRLVAGLNYAYALPGVSSRGHDNVIMRYRKAYTLTNNWHYYYANPSWGYYDTSPGSLTRVAEDAEAQSKKDLRADWPSNTFMPTISALDVQDAGSINSPNFNYNVRQQIPLNDRPNRAKYAFDAYFAASSVNEPHVQITNAQGSSVSGNASYYTDNASWIQNELRESAHRMPALLTTVYNYGNAYRHLLPAVQINSGGRLYLNNSTLPTNGGTPALQSVPNAGNFEVYTPNCGTVVQVNNGGQVYVGMNTNYAASLRISANSLLDLWNGGQLTVAEGSVLRIVAGGTLVVRQGTILTVAGQLIIEPGAYLCLANGQSIATTGAGQVTISPSAYRYANPALGLTGLNCQSGTCPSTLRLTSQCKDPVSPGSCSTQAVVTATGSSLGIDYRWTVDGQAYSTGNGQASISVFTSKTVPTHTVSVQVSSTCLGGTPLTVTQRVGCSFPDCGPRGGRTVAMYPNPATNEVKFDLQDEQASSTGAPAMKTSATAEKSTSSTPAEYEVNLYDSRGTLRWHGRSQGGILQLNSSALPRGIYGVVITQGETVIQRNLSLE